MATPNVVMKAKAYGGMVRSWALAAVYPSDLMILGCGPRQNLFWFVLGQLEDSIYVTYQEERVRV
jgi:hypothetical protein